MFRAVYKECQRSRIFSITPDINESKEDFSASGDIIRLGLSAVAKVGQSAVRNIIESREKEGKFQSF